MRKVLFAVTVVDMFSLLYELLKVTTKNIYEKVTLEKYSTTSINIKKCLKNLPYLVRSDWKQNV